MPRVWLLFMSWLADVGAVSALRACLNRALQSLPVTQHALVWGHWSTLPLPLPAETRTSVTSRQLMFDSHKRVAHAQALLAEGNTRAGVLQLMAAVDEEARTGRKSSAEDAWGLLAAALAELADPGSIPAARILRSGIARRPHECGVLWCTLAELSVRAGAFEAARDVYEEAVSSVGSVRDFALVFDAYVKFEEALLAAAAEEEAEAGSKGLAEGKDASFSELLPVSSLGEAVDDEDLRFARLEQLIDRQPLLLSSVLLRQNPHNVHEWARRATTFAKLDAPSRVVETYADAIKTVDPTLAVGKPHTLWAALARFYEGRGELDEARAVLRHGTSASFPSSEPIVTLWCAWAEMELRNGCVPEAVKVAHAAVARRGVRVAEKLGAAGALVSQRDVSSSSRLWALVLDLDMAYATLPALLASFNAAAAAKAVTVASVLVVAAHFAAASAVEEAFRVYQAGLTLFHWPLSADIWYAYLDTFVGRYGGAKLERARDLFDSALGDCPPSASAALLRLYATFEERHGSLRRCMSLLDRASDVVDPSDRYGVYAVYLSKAAEYYGAVKCRPIYEKALQACSPEQAKILARRFAALETQLGEVDRARAALRFGAQFADPKADAAYWAAWAEWEVANGTEETYRDLLRTKRSYVLSAAPSAIPALSITAVKAGGGT
jgi:pre-mRNA-splicing factor SYF1